MTAGIEQPVPLGFQSKPWSFGYTEHCTVTTLKAGAYQSLQTGDTFSHVGILDPAL
jgi:hypothetical protein